MQLFQPVIFTLLILFAGLVSAQPYWTDASMAKRSDSAQSTKGRYYHLDLVRLKTLLDAAGHENGSGQPVQVNLPMQDGSLQVFSVLESPVLAPHVAARFPDFKTYKIHGVDDPGASGRLSLNSSGFRAMVSNSEGTSYIDAVEGGRLYRQYGRKSSMPAQPFNCGVKGHDHSHPLGTARFSPKISRRTPGSLQTYRLAVAGTAEYVRAVAAGNPVQAFAEVTNAITRVNQIFERDLGIRLILSSGAGTLYTNAITDPYTDDIPEALISQNQINLDNVIGDANYDVGHVFSTGGGGLAGVGVVCSTGRKAEGVTGITTPLGEDFYIDYVAHEIGHQFGGDHTFNGTTLSCQGGQRAPATAYEPGSGSTIMAYAGICGGENLQAHSDAVFHSGSIRQIDTFTTTGLGATCGGVVTASNPNEPSINAGEDFSIPSFTPFQLNATAADSDGDTLTYTWDQINVGSSTTSNTLGSDFGTNALFRSYLPRTQNYRHFPALGTTLQNKYDRSEAFACQDRTLIFRVSARDQKSRIGRDDVRVTVDRESGPFRVTAFNTTQTLAAGQVVILTWDVASTNVAPVNCAQVDVSLLTFNEGKTSYAETLLVDDVANNGVISFNLPASNTAARARFKVQCNNNTFYDVSDADLAITGSGPDYESAGIKVFYNSNGSSDMFRDTLPTVCPEPISADGEDTETTTNSTPAAAAGGGGGSFGMLVLWLLGLYVYRPRSFRAGTFQ